MIWCTLRGFHGLRIQRPGQGASGVLAHMPRIFVTRLGAEDVIPVPLNTCAPCSKARGEALDAIACCTAIPTKQKRRFTGQGAEKTP